MTKQRTTNLLGRTFESSIALRDMLIDREKYGYCLLEIVIKMAFDGALIVPAALLRIWGRAGVTAERIDTFMRYGYSYVDNCILCQLCMMDSCEIIFKPAGVWLEAILDIFPRNSHVSTAENLISLSNGFSGEILDT